MPLSKAKQAEWMREYRKRGGSVIPKAKSVIPKAKSVIPNRYLSAHLAVCPGYDPVQPKDHFNHCPYINPLLREPESLPNCPDGRYRPL